MDERKFMIFKLGEDTYGIDLGSVDSIENSYSVVPVPNADEDIRGIINLRGNVIPVYSLKRRFGQNPRCTGPDKSLLITRSSGTIVGYEVDAVETIAVVEPKNICPMPFVASNKETELMDEVIMIDKKLIVVINADKILSEEMIAKVNQIVEDNSSSK